MTTDEGENSAKAGTGSPGPSEASPSGGESTTATASSSTAPTTATAPAAASLEIMTSEDLARRWQAIDNLTSIFGFPSNIAEQAVDQVGVDVTTAYNYILDNNLASDSGGPVTPIDNCPHVEQHVTLTESSIGEALAEFGLPQNAPCSHNSNDDMPPRKKAGGGLKADPDDDGSCPSKENWMCLECGVIRCSRYQNSHSLAHWEHTQKATKMGSDSVGHCVAVSFSDLSVWCYVCQSYLKHPTKLAPLVSKLEKLKFP